MQEGEGVQLWAEFVFGGRGQHCEEILITQGGIVWEEIVKSVLGWLCMRGMQCGVDVWAPTEHSR